MSTGEFSLTTRVVAGRGCVAERLPAELAALGVPLVAVVADRGLAEAGLLEPLLAAVDGLELTVCALVEEDPSIHAAEEASTAARESGAQAVLTIGGGSALGVGKAVAIRLTNDGSLHDWLGRDRVPRRPAPCIAVPTTAGSGGEVSNALVLTDPQTGRHVVIRGRGCEPDVALLDGEMLRTLPRRPMIYAAVDALSHALEALWVRGATSFSDAMARTAADTIAAVLPAALERDGEAMQRLMEASAMANVACGNSGLGLVHALSSSLVVPLPHGYENGVLLPHVATFNRDVVDPAALPVIDGLAALYDEIGFPSRFADGEIDLPLARRMAAAAMSNPFRANNRREAQEPELVSILCDAGAGSST